MMFAGQALGGNTVKDRFNDTSKRVLREDVVSNKVLRHRKYGIPADTKVSFKMHRETLDGRGNRRPAFRHALEGTVIGETHFNSPLVYATQPIACLFRRRVDVKGCSVRSLRPIKWELLLPGAPEPRLALRKVRASK